MLFAARKTAGGCVALYKTLDESWQPMYIAGYLFYVRMMDDNYFLTIYGHCANLLNNISSYIFRHV